MGSDSFMAKKMRRESEEREQMAHNTPHEAHKRVLSVFGVRASSVFGRVHRLESTWLRGALVALGRSAAGELLNCSAPRC